MSIGREIANREPSVAESDAGGDPQARIIGTPMPQPVRHCAQASAIDRPAIECVNANDAAHAWIVLHP